MKENISKCIEESVQTITAVRKECMNEIQAVAEAILAAYRKEKKVIIFGNGGSAADSQHMAAELVGRFKKDRRAFAAIALTTNTSVITSLSNDYTFDCIFERQIEALGQKDDIAIGISTSGTAKNVIAGLQKARMSGLHTVALTGARGDNLKEYADICLRVPAADTPRIQEAHILIIHIICQLVEAALAS